ncbi:MAG: phosphate ABC transporter permease subunit PstC [Candidatus Margulisiibacteriota bacterium]
MINPKKEKKIEKLFTLIAYSSLMFLLGIMFVLFKEGLPLVREINMRGFLFGHYWYPTHTSPEFGILPLVSATLFVTFGAMVIAIWLGISSALFLHELAGPRLRNILKPVIEILAAIPSIVYGFFGMLIVAPFVQNILDLPVGLCALSASLILGLMAVPTVCSMTEDALNYVPRHFKEASLAIGATRWQTLLYVMIPAAGSGISTAVILGMSRVIGETMTVLMVAGGAAVIPTSYFQPVRTMTATIAAEMGETVIGSTHYHALFMIGLILFAMTMVLNIIADNISKKCRCRLGLGQ